MKDHVWQWLTGIILGIIGIIVSIVLFFFSSATPPTQISSITGEDNVQIVDSPGTKITIDEQAPEILAEETFEDKISEAGKEIQSQEESRIAIEERERVIALVERTKREKKRQENAQLERSVNEIVMDKVEEGKEDLGKIKGLRRNRKMENVAIGKNSKANLAAVNLENSEDAFMQIERILEKMKEANISFNTPPSMNLKEIVEIQLVLSLMKQIEELEQMIEAKGEKESARINVSNRMEARLSSTDFEINAIMPEEQAITLSGVTEWKWEIKPKRTGNLRLHLTLTAIFTVDGEKTKRAIRTFDKTIEIQVTLWQTTSTFISQNWQWLWTAIIIPIGGWLLSRWRKRKKTTTQF